MAKPTLIILAAALACDTPPPAPKREISALERRAHELQQAYVDLGEASICRGGADGAVEYIVCRPGGSDAGSTVWHFTNGTAQALNGDALQDVDRLGKAWILSAPRPAPAGVDIAKAKAVAR